MKKRKNIKISQADRIICGVAGGTAEYFDIDPVWIRLIFLAFCLVGPSFVGFFYVVLYLCMGEE